MEYSKSKWDLLKMKWSKNKDLEDRRIYNKCSYINKCRKWPKIPFVESIGYNCRFSFYRFVFSVFYVTGLKHELLKEAESW